MKILRTLRVYPNPYHHLDHEGRPCGVLPWEPEGDGVTTFDSRRFVGATLQAVITKKFPKGDARQTEQDTTFIFSDEAVQVNDTPYYRRAIKSGEIFAADADTARRAAVPFMEPTLALTNAKAGALHHLKNIHVHEDHDEETHAALIDHSFGPMAEAIKGRVEANKVAKAEVAKKSADKPAQGGNP